MKIFELSATIVLVALLLASSAPVQAATKPSVVASGLSGLFTMGSDPYGNLFYITQSGNVASLYMKPIWSSTPVLVFTDGSNSVTTPVPAFLVYLSFSAFGNVYFIDDRYAPDFSSVQAQVVTLNYLVGFTSPHSLPHPRILYSATFNYGSPETGRSIDSLAVNWAGDVAVGSSVSATGAVWDSQIIYFPHSTGPGVVKADFGPGTAEAADSQINNRGDVFASVFSLNTFLFSPYEVRSDGSIVALPLAFSSDTPQMLQLDKSGDLYVISRTLVNPSCTGVADKTTFTIVEFTDETLETNSPIGVTLSLETFPGYQLLITNSPDQVTVLGSTLFYVTYPSTTNTNHCTDSTNYPLTFDGQIIGFKAGSAHPSVLVYEPAPGTTHPGLFVASFGGSLYYGSSLSGNIYLIHTQYGAGE